MPFQSRKVLHSTSNIWVNAGGTDSTSAPTIETINLKDADSCVITAVADVTTPSAGAFTIANATDIATKSTHGFKTGLAVTVSSDNALPTGLSASTTYYISVLSANTFYFSTTYANALAGTPIDVSDDGTGTHTVTPTTFAGTLKLQYADLSQANTWFDVPNQTKTITADGNSIWEIDYIRMPDWRIYPNITAGYATLSAIAYPRD